MRRNIESNIENRGEPAMTLVLMKINNVFAYHTAMVYMYIELRVYANLNGCARVLLCHSSISRQKVIVKPPRKERREKKKRRLISFGLASDPLPSSYITMGFPVGISSRK